MAGKLELLDVEAVLFDLDGTIIDSYSGIQQAFDEAYFLSYSTKNNVSIRPYIGPPIDKILVALNNETDAEKIASFVRYFKYSYDNVYYKSSILYKGINDLLEELNRYKKKMFIVTNKRENATKLIIDFLNLNPFFSGYYCSDSKKYYSSKTVIVKDLLEVEKLDNQKCILIGDTLQDKISAQDNNISFVFASYGYGELNEIERVIQHPIQALNFINYK